MCWNASVSFNTYFLSLFASCLALLNGIINWHYLVFFQSFMLMQLLEFFTWTYMKHKQINQILSVLGLTLILLQPLAAIVLLVTSKYKSLVPFLCGFYVLGVLIVMFQTKFDYRMTKASNGHLLWHWLSLPSWFVIIWFTTLLIPFIYLSEWSILAFVVTTAIISYVTFSQTGTWGSLWCWFVNIVAFVLIIKVFLKEFC